MTSEDDVMWNCRQEKTVVFWGAACITYVMSEWYQPALCFSSQEIASEASAGQQEKQS